MYANATRDRRDLSHSIRRFSDSLGPTPAAVASRLKSLSVRGTPRDSNRLRNCADLSISNIWVTERRVHVKPVDSRFPMIVRLPKPVALFIRAFDTGCYPELLIDFRQPIPPAGGTLPSAGDGKRDKAESRRSERPDQN
jgi:hypothetical protein